MTVHDAGHSRGNVLTTASPVWLIGMSEPRLRKGFAEHLAEPWPATMVSLRGRF